MKPGTTPNPTQPQPPGHGMHVAEWALWIALSLSLWAAVWFVAGVLVGLLSNQG